MEFSWRPTTICISIFFLKQWVSKRSQNGTKPLLILFLFLFIFIKIQKQNGCHYFKIIFLVPMVTLIQKNLVLQTQSILPAEINYSQRWYIPYGKEIVTTYMIYS